MFWIIWSENFRLNVGAVSESITVEADAFNVNTTDGTVSTVVDRTSPTTCH